MILKMLSADRSWSVHCLLVCDKKVEKLEVSLETSLAI